MNLDTINLDAPDEHKVMQALYATVPSNELRGFLDVFTEDEVIRMFNGDLSDWSWRNRLWLAQTVQNILDRTT